MENQNNLNNLNIFHDWVMCKAIKEEREMGGLQIGKTYEEKTSKGEVIKIGENVKLPVKVGDIIYFSAYAPIELEYGDTTYLMLKEEDLIGRHQG